MFIFKSSASTSNTQVNNTGNKAAMAALIFGGVFSIILAILIIRSLINLRKIVFPLKRTFAFELRRHGEEFESQTVVSSKHIKLQDPKLHFYSTCFAFVVLFLMFLAITVIFFKSAFDLNAIRGNWTSTYLKGTNKALSIIPIFVATLCFMAAVFFAFKLTEDITSLYTKRSVHLIKDHNGLSRTLKKHKAPIHKWIWYLSEVTSLILCIAIVVACIYLTWDIFNG